jgi:hypothetical protein
MANANPANIPPVPLPPMVPPAVVGRTYLNMLRNAGIAVRNAGVTVRNRALYPAGRWLRNVGLPRTRNAGVAVRNRALYPAGRWLRNVGLPGTRNALGTGAVALRNRALYPAGRWARNVAAPAAANFTRRCVGATCRRGAATAAWLGLDVDLDDGLAITARDRAIMLSLPAAQGSAQFTAFSLEGLENNLHQRVTNYLMDNGDTIGNADGGLSVEEYKSLVPRYAKDLKTLYMIKLTSMGRQNSEIVSLSNNAAAGILMQIHLLKENELGNNQVLYDRFTGSELQPLLDQLNEDNLSEGAFYENSNGNANANGKENEGESKMDGGKRRTRRRRNRRSTRRT